jgi:hypothetical protein
MNWVKAKWREVSSGSRLLPDFLVIGAQRCGTSTLYQYLKLHPGVGGAARKEVGFFDLHFQRGLDWYRAQFPTERQKRSVLARNPIFLTGEASPNYLIDPGVPSRVAAALPGVKLIVILRHPVLRTYSGYNRAVRTGHESRSFAEIVASELANPLEEWDKVKKDPGRDTRDLRLSQFLARGLYAVQLEHWLKFFPRNQLLAVNGDQFFKQPRTWLNQVCEFLGLPPWSEETFHESAERPVQRWMARKYHYTYPPMEDAVRQQLVDFFRPHNQRLSDLLDQDFGWDR